MENIVDRVYSNVNAYISGDLAQPHSTVSREYVQREVFNKFVMLRDGLMDGDYDQITAQLSERIKYKVKTMYDSEVRYRSEVAPTNVHAKDEEYNAAVYSEAVSNPVWVGKDEKIYKPRELLEVSTFEDKLYKAQTLVKSKHTVNDKDMLHKFTS
tara:strand:- start:114 stop:578 length:465 start_codon:yes stop_codon:yes gene_type:complete